jgi:hypothetical protein
VTGSSFFAESIFPMDAVQFNDGELKRYEHVSEGSQKKVFVHFCPSCSTSVGLTFGAGRTFAPSRVAATTTPTPLKSRAIYGLSLPRLGSYCPGALNDLSEHSSARRSGSSSRKNTICRS